MKLIFEGTANEIKKVLQIKFINQQHSTVLGIDGKDIKEKPSVKQPMAENQSKSTTVKTNIRLDGKKFN